MVVVGIDSAELTGVAILDGTRLAKHSAITIAGWKDVERAAETLAEYHPDLVAIEDCFVRQNDHTGLLLAKLIGRWAQALERRGVLTIQVLASTWQPAVLPGITNRSRRAERKAAAVAWAAHTFGEALPEDQADACGIAWWAAAQGTFRRGDAF